jgi:hypothetical protein
LKNCVAPNPFKTCKTYVNSVFQPPLLFIGISHNVHKDNAYKGYHVHVFTIDSNRADSDYKLCWNYATGRPQTCTCLTCWSSRFSGSYLCYSGKVKDQTSIRKPTILRHFAVSSVPPGRYVKSGHDGFILLRFPVPYSLFMPLTIRCATQSALLKTSRNWQTIN